MLCYVVSEQLSQRQARMQASLAVEKLGARLVEGAGARTRSAKVPAQGLVEASAPEAAKRAAFAAATVVIVGDNASRPSGCGDDVTVAKFEWMVNLLKLKKPLPPDDYLVGAARAAPAPAPSPSSSSSPRSPRSPRPLRKLHEGFACGGKPAAVRPKKHAEVVAALEELHDYYQMDPKKQTWSAQQLPKLIKKLDGLNRVLTDDDMDEDALLGILGKGFKGSSAKKVIDIWQTGTLQSLEDYRANEEFGALKCLSKIWGIGPATARKLYDATGARNVVELRSAVRLNPRLVQPNVHTTLSCHEDLQARMPRSEAAAIADRVKACAEKLFAELGNAGALSVTAAGSFRRGKETCGDLDVLITAEAWRGDDDGPDDASSIASSSLPSVDGVARDHPDLAARRTKPARDDFLRRLVDALSDAGLMKHTLAGNMHFGKKGSVFGEVADCGAASFMGICRLDSLPHRRIDVKVYAPQHYACALLYFTGSDHFNRSMRCFAKAKGFTLCDRGLRPTVRRGKATDSRGKYVDNKVAVGRPVEFEREEDVFAFLELPYKTPPERALDDNAAGIAAAAARVRAENNVDVDDDDDAGAEVFVGQRPQLSLWSGAK